MTKAKRGNNFLNNIPSISILDDHMAQRPVQDLLNEAANTFKERNALYGNNYKDFGAALLACFGGSIPEIKTAEDANRLSLIMNCLGKLGRYCQNFENGGHADSAHDLIVYAAMLEEITK